MKINNCEVNIENLINFNNEALIKYHHNDIYLNKKEISILNKYNFNYKNYNRVSELIFDIECFLNNSNYNDYSDLEWVSENLSEFNYYYNTNK